MSETLDLFKAALGLGEPWRVTRSDFDVAQGRLDLYLDFPRGARFGCSVAGCDQGSCPVHDTEDKTWRHLDFFQYKAFLHARVPRTRCPEHGVHLVEVVWARPESGFTLLFEALLIEFATAMPVARVAAMAREHDTRVWRVLEHHVAVQREKLSFADVRRVGMDETSARTGQEYVTTFMDLDARRVLFATEGRDSATVRVRRRPDRAWRGSGADQRHEFGYESGVHRRYRGAPAEREADLRPVPRDREAERGGR
jgi:transposase